MKKSIHYEYVNCTCPNKIHYCVYLIYANKILSERKQITNASHNCTCLFLLYIAVINTMTKSNTGRLVYNLLLREEKVMNIKNLKA